MSIQMRCEYCGRRLRVSEKAAGRFVRCPGCRNVLSVPATSHAEQRHREGDSRSERPSEPSRAGFWARRRAKKLKREVRAMRAPLDQHLEKLGLLILESTPAEVHIHDELQALSHVQKQLKEREEALESLQEAKADRSLLKELREEAKQLRDRQRELMIQIGRKADWAGADVPGAKAQYAVVRRLRSMLEDKEERLRDFERQFGQVELRVSVRSVVKIVLVVLLLGALGGGGYYAHSSGLFLRGIGLYKAWRVTRRVRDKLARCRESLSVAEKEVGEFQERVQSVLGDKPLTGSLDLRRALDRILADLDKRDQVPPSVIGEAVSRYRATIEKRIQRISSDLRAAQEEARLAVQRMTESAEQLLSQIEEAGGRYTTTRRGRTVMLPAYAQSASLQQLWKTLQEIDKQVSACARNMELAQRKYEFALRNEQDRLNPAIADYENLRQAQLAYLLGDYRKARQLLEDVPEGSPARQHERHFWKAAAEAARPDNGRQREGYVVAVWDGKIAVNIGGQAGLIHGSILAVELSERPIVDPQRPDRVLGYDETTIRVQEVRTKSSVCRTIPESRLIPRPGDRVRIQKLRP